MSTAEIPLADVDQIRRHVAAQYGLTIRENDPIVMSVALAMMATRQVISEERAKRADENLLTYKDVRHVLMEVRDDAIQTSRDIAAVTVHHTHECVMEKLDDARIKWFSARYHIRTGIAVLIGSIFGAITAVTLTKLF
jgi:hypothetical protein